MAARIELHGLRVLVTRPERQARALCDLIEASGGEARNVPTTVIGPPADAESARGMLREAGDCVIFVSRSAVEFAARLAPDLAGLLAGRVVFAAGAGTARELANLGVNSEAPVAAEGSDGLLRLKALQPSAVSGRDVLIVRGGSGREALRDELLRRGARVRYAEVYTRQCPETSALNDVWRNAPPDIIVTTSNQGLENLVSITAGSSHAALFGTPLIVTSERARARATELGFRGRIVTAPSAGDAELLRSLGRLAEELRDR